MKHPVINIIMLLLVCVTIAKLLSNTHEEFERQKQQIEQLQEKK